MSIVQDPSHPDGVHGSPGDKGGSALTRAKHRKARSALALKVRGYNSEDIAIAVGYPNGAAVNRAIEVALGEELSELDRKAVRQVAVRRLERSWQALQAIIENPAHPNQIAAINSGVKVTDRLAKLIGLDAPTEVIVTSPAAAEIQQWVDEALDAERALTGAGALPVDDDVLEGEWTEDADGEEDDLVEIEDDDAVPTD